MTIKSSEQFRFLRTAGYFIAFATMFVQILELLLRLWPLRISSAEWRLGFIAGTSSITPAIFLMLFLVLAIASYFDDRPLTYTASALSVSAAVLQLILTGAFAMDALQLRNQVQMAVAHRYDITSVWTIIRLLIGVVGFTLLGLGGFGGARWAQRSTPRTSQRGGTLVVGAGRPPIVTPVERTAEVNNS